MTELKGIVRTVQVNLNEPANQVALIFHCHPGYGAIELYEHLIIQAKAGRISFELIANGGFLDQREEGSG